MKRFVATEPSTLGHVLALLRDDEQAVREGRVFVGRKRATSDRQAIQKGDEIFVHPPREELPLPDPFVLHHGDGVVAVDKPAGIPTIPDVRGAQGTLVDLAARAIFVPASELHPTSRLDREVSGVVTFAITPEARTAIATAREQGKYERRYLAIARGTLPDQARFTWSIARAKDPKLRRAADGEGEPAATRMVVVERAGDYALLAIAPETGRTHQIRVHLARAGAPLLGDRAYGGISRLTTPTGKSMTVGRVALHCARVAISLPRCMITVASPVPPELVSLAAAIGLSRFAEALSCAV
ncbi:MAG: RluA family pseudouridine synthase [Polyangiales bacterium]